MSYSERIKKENILSSYRMSKNPKYQAVCSLANEMFDLALAKQLVSKVLEESG